MWQSVVWALRNYRIHLARASLSIINHKMKAGIKLLPIIVLFQNFCRANDDFMKIWILSATGNETSRDLECSYIVEVTSLSSLFKSDVYKMADRKFE